MSTAPDTTPFVKAARTVAGRVVRRRFARYLRATSPVIALLTLGLVLALRQVFLWRENEWLAAGGLLLAWLATGVVVSRWRRPGTEGALLLLDRVGGWKDCFSSAWEFLYHPDRDAARSLHLERAGQLLPDAVERFPAAFPVLRTRWFWTGPLLALALSVAPWWRVPPGFHEAELTEAMREAAALQSEQLNREADRLNETTSLTEEEKNELEALRAEVDSVAETLANPEGLAAGEVLESLEERAKAAERLAEKLAPVSDEWASAAMVEEMGQHPDTADLALFIRDKSATGAAGESERLRELLADDSLTSDTQERVTRSLESIIGKATDADLTRPVGERFGNASTKMLTAQPKTAAREFEELAKHFREMAGREGAREQLEELAENLREAGSEIGGSELQQRERKEQLAESGSPGKEGPAGLMPIEDADPAEASQKLPLPSMPGAVAPESPPVPGTPLAMQKEGSEGQAPGSAPGAGEKGDGKEPGKEMLQAPVPGEAPPEGQNGSGLGLSDRSREGKGEGGMLSAPIPGEEPGQSAPGAGLAAGPSTSSQSGQGGDQAGTGTAELVEEASETLKASGDAKVVARAGGEGDSSFRSVEGEVKAEEASRARQSVVADFLAVEEQALDEQSLPLSRRQHVLRYFSAIRAQFEKSEPEK